MKENTIALNSGFWKYFWNVIKQAKWLFIVGIASSLMWMLTSIFANTLILSELTYYNAMITLLGFFDIVCYGVSQGALVLFSKNEDKLEEKLKVASYINATIIIAISVFMFSAKDLIMTDILNVPNTANDAFYYMMAGFFLFRGISRYYENCLRLIGMTRQQMTSSIIILICMLTGQSILILTGGISLYFIPLIFFIAQAGSFAYCAWQIKRELKINIFSLTKIRLTKTEFKIIMGRLLSELFWQVAFTLTMIFMLRINAKAYNTFSYYENVLDILNMVYFAFIYVTSVQIAREIGRKKYNSAFKVAKYSIYISMLSWVGFFVLSGILCYPLLLGLNPELFEVGLMTYFLYVALYFFFFVSWNLSSYVLALGGKNLAQIIIQFCSIVYYVVLIFVAHLLPQNVFLIYGLLILQSFVVIIADLIMFFRKKWMAEGEVKAIIFDFDGTMYDGLSRKPWNEFYEKACQHFFNKTPLELGITQNTDKEFIRKLMENGHNPEKWHKYKRQNHIKFDYTNVKSASNSVLRRLARRYKLYIVSNSSYAAIIEKSKALKLDTTIFKNILINPFKPTDISKQPVYKQILNCENLLPNEVLCVGDNFEEDLLPAQNLGMKIMQVQSCDFKAREIKSRISLCQSEDNKKRDR